MNATVLTPPTPLTYENIYGKGNRPSVFLAGSIEMGKADDWQTKMITSLAHLPITILNPRRADWDASWVQSKDNPQFRGQVEWELDGLNKANLVVMVLLPGTISPISLLELGLMADDGVEIMIYCPEGFHRKGNIDIVAERYDLLVYEDWDTFVEDVVEALTPSTF